MYRFLYALVRMFNKTRFRGGRESPNFIAMCLKIFDNFWDTVFHRLTAA